MGRLNRLIEIQRKVITRDPRFGSEVETWVKLDTVWAHVNQTGVSEDFDNDAHRAIPLRNATIRIRWRDDVKETSRVVYDGFLWDIKGIAELGYRRELDLFCQTDASRRVPVEAPGRERRDAEVEDDRKPADDALPDGQQPEPGPAPKQDWTDGP